MKPLNHNRYLNLLKRILKADFVGWVTEKDKKFLRVKVGGNDHLLPLEGNLITKETYEQLINELVTNEQQE